MDLIFDHLDRCEFLDRFPLIKIDQAGFAELARSLDLPSWTAWVEDIVRHAHIQPGSRPPADKTRFDAILADTPIYKPRLRSHAATLMAAKFRNAVEQAILDGKWQKLSDAGRMLGIASAWQGIAQAFSRGASPPADPRAEEPEPVSSP